VLRFLSANDSGRVMNRLTFDNQVVGGSPWDRTGHDRGPDPRRKTDRQDGQSQRARLQNSRPLSMFRLKFVLAIELEDMEANTTGAKGLGEPVTIRLVSSSCQCSLSRIGIRVTTSPIHP